MRLIDRTLLGYSCFLPLTALLVPQNTILRTPMFQFRQLLSKSDHFDITQLISPKPTNEFSSGIAHASVIKNGSVHYLHVSNYLLSLYVKSSNLRHAHQLFDEMSERDVRSWTVLISGLSRIKSYKLALDLFGQMQKDGITPNQFTFSSVLKCCAGANELNMGKTILGSILRNHISLDIALNNSVLDLFVKCEDLDYATKFFELMSGKDTVSWNIMMNAYLKNGDTEKAEGLFWRLPVKKADSWNTVIDGYLQNGREEIALQFLYQMVTAGTTFTGVTFSIALILASCLNHMKLGKQIHGQLVKVGIHDAFVKNSLIDMYCKCGQVEKAMIIFKSSKRYINGELISLGSIVNGYIQNGRIDTALNVFSVMVSERGEIDKFTLTSVFSACAGNGLLNLGQLIHTYIIKNGHEPDVFLSSSMIDMYSKCGRLQSAYLIFKETKIQNVVLWTTIISSFASHGKGNETIRLFEAMQNEGITPNEVTFVVVLTACSHAGLVNEGCNYFTLMKKVYGIDPKVEHYTCMVDLLGRNGRLDEITDFIYENNISHLGVVWKAFLSSCYLHKNVEMAKWVCEKLNAIEPFEVGSYVLMANTCASDSNWEEAAKLKDLMNERGIKKQPVYKSLDIPKVRKDEEGAQTSIDNVTKNSFRLLALSKPNVSIGLQRLTKSIKTLSQSLGFKEETDDEQMEFEIGLPTDVKHVAHVGFDGSVTSEANRRGDLTPTDFLGFCPISFARLEERLAMCLPSDESHDIHIS